jgi:hypothetical protein
MTITIIILSIVFAILSGISKAIMDLSEEGKLKGNPIFWHKSQSWKNKWKGGLKKNGEKFFGSSRWFVLFTDAWHLFGVLFRATYAKAYISVGLLISINIWYAFGALVVYIIFATTFHIFHTYKILRK